MKLYIRIIKNEKTGISLKMILLNIIVKNNFKNSFDVLWFLRCYYNLC